MFTWNRRAPDVLHRWFLRHGSLRGLLGAIRFRIPAFRGWICILYGLSACLDFAPTFKRN